MDAPESFRVILASSGGDERDPLEIGPHLNRAVLVLWSEAIGRPSSLLSNLENLSRNIGGETVYPNQTLGPKMVVF